ncbi:pyruvate kinase [Burkholderia sp. THE68]|uniref:pyruvate kinase n=1 Tax=Burkholderia sp. THE68 TaxID=758782 RepID=UPI0013193F1F|nr:pyruvate kinase [Burkholderia sp. THE68]BBU30371.1 pyruvate kinase [Burkholderia sp. THE68]
MCDKSGSTLSTLKSTKIVATLGPASSNEQVIETMAQAGVDVFRLNFSHGSHDDHAARHSAIRRVEAKIGRPLGILLDLQGPKLRVGPFEGEREKLKKNQTFTFDDDNRPGDNTRVFLPHPEIFAAIRAGHHLLVDDGKMRFQVERVVPGKIVTRVMTEGTISDRKGVSLPEATLDIPALSKKDREDLSFGLELGVDWVALSFVQSEKDIHEARELIGEQALIVAKIEKPQAVENIVGVVRAADGLMVARGDLGVEMRPEEVPGVQKRIVRLARDAGKPVIVATQMLESMTTSSIPTRAEASDVATAVYDGADAVMLSAESASGSFPVESVEIMHRVIAATERDPLYRELMKAISINCSSNGTDAIGAAIEAVSDTLPLAIAVTYTSSGTTPMRLARLRPRVGILSLAPRVEVARRLALVWGVHSRVTKEADGVEDIIVTAVSSVRAEGLANTGRSIVVAAGVPFGRPGSTNLLRVVSPEEVTGKA